MSLVPVRPLGPGEQVVPVTAYLADSVALLVTVRWGAGGERERGSGVKERTAGQTHASRRPAGAAEALGCSPLLGPLPASAESPAELALPVPWLQMTWT